MKKIILSTLLLSLPFTVYADKIDYAFDMLTKCKETKNRKICLRAAKAQIAIIPRSPVPNSRYDVIEEAATYNRLSRMFDGVCFSRVNWRKEACQLQQNYWHKYKEAKKRY